MEKIKRLIDHDIPSHEYEGTFPSSIPNVQLASSPPNSQPCKAVTRKHLWLPCSDSAVPDLSAHAYCTGWFLCLQCPSLHPSAWPLIHSLRSASKCLLSKILLDPPNQSQSPPLCVPLWPVCIAIISLVHPALGLLFNHSFNGGNGVVRKYIGSGTWVQILTPTFISNVALGKLRTLSVPQFPNLLSRVNIDISLVSLLRSVTLDT